MSSGKFTKAVYEADGGTFHRIRVQPETLSTTPANPSSNGTVNSPFAAIVSANSKKKGVLIPRHLNISRTIASSDPDYNTLITNKLAVLTKAVYTTLSARATITYLGQTWDINSAIGERINR